MDTAPVPPPAARVADLPLAAELSAVSARLSGLVLSESSVRTALEPIGVLAVETVPAAAGAGVTVGDEHGRRTRAATNPVVERADAWQYELDEGPCLAAWSGRSPVRVEDTRTEGRWPRWCAAARDLGLRSALSVPLVTGDQAVGAIKVYGTTPRAFGSRDEQLLTLFATQAAVLVAHLQADERARRLSAGLRTAVRDRDRVNTARGVVMAREGVDEVAALGLLLDRSRDEGVPLVDVARSVLRSAIRRRR
jgi:GAF domain-containing protein